MLNNLLTSIVRHTFSNDKNTHNGTSAYPYSIGEVGGRKNGVVRPKGPSRTPIQSLIPSWPLSVRQTKHSLRKYLLTRSERGDPTHTSRVQEGVCEPGRSETRPMKSPTEKRVSHIGTGDGLHDIYVVTNKFITKSCEWTMGIQSWSYQCYHIVFGTGRPLSLVQTLLEYLVKNFLEKQYFYYDKNLTLPSPRALSVDPGNSGVRQKELAFVLHLSTVVPRVLERENWNREEKELRSLDLQNELPTL